MYFPRHSLVLSVFIIALECEVLAINWQTVFQQDASKTLEDVSPQCSNDTQTWINSLELFAEISTECILESNCTANETSILKDNLYAVKQLDAFGKFPLSGLFEIPLLFDGSYQECERISGEKYETNYCYLVLFPGKNSTCQSDGSLIASTFFRSAVCMPYSCDKTDLPKVFNQLSNLPFTACLASCSKNHVEKDSAFWGFSAFMLVIIVLALLATLFDYVREIVFEKQSSNEKNIAIRIFLAFSFWTNAGLILSVKEQKPGFIKSLDCIRFFSMMWVVTGHTFTYLTIPDTLMSLSTFMTKFWNHLLLNAFVSVDSFFLLSGIVVAYLFFKERPKKAMMKSPLTWVLFYVHRYLRLTPPMMIFIGFFTVYIYYIQGAWSAVEFNQLIPQAENCKKTWWRNMLYINNLGNSDGACYGITWYLAVDTQLYLIAPIILIAFYFSFAAGGALIVAGCVGSIITTYILFSDYDLAADFFGNGDVNDFYSIIYTKPWIRCPPYLVGLFVGYMLAVYGKRQVRLNWVLSLIGWIVAFGIGAGCLFATYDYDQGSKWSVFSRATFYNFSRLGWAIALSWVIIANHMGWGGPINNFMSHPIWQPFGRLSYCAYIVHYMVLYWFLNIGDASIHYYSAWQIFFYYAFPTTIVSYIFGFFWSCLFEMPTLKLEKMLIEAIIGNKAKTSHKVETGEKAVIGNRVSSWDEPSETKIEAF